MDEHTKRKYHVRDRARREPFTSHEEMPQKKPNIVMPSPWTSILLNCEKIDFCCLSPPSLWNFVMAVLAN